jgi:hypothetical protein
MTAVDEDGTSDLAVLLKFIQFRGSAVAADVAAWFGAQAVASQGQPQFQQQARIATNAHTYMTAACTLKFIAQQP